MASTTPSPVQLDAKFLTNPAPSTISSSIIDFASSPLPQYAGKYAQLITDVLTPEECKQLISLAEASVESQVSTKKKGAKETSPWRAAMVNAGGGREIMSLDTRDSGRIILDHQELANRLLARIQPFIPSEIVNLTSAAHITGLGPWRRRETWQISRLNERMRFLRYQPGQYFREHCDGNFRTDDGETSFLTFHLYLNGDGVEGGATKFLPGNWREEPTIDINPRPGSVLLFQQRDLWHEGAEVTKGTKFTVRTDVMYKIVPVASKDETKGKEDDQKPQELAKGKKTTKERIG